MMKANVHEKAGRLDWLKWSVAGLILAALVVLAGGNGIASGVGFAHEFAARSALLRWPVLVLLGAAGVAVAFLTSQGAAFLELAKAARGEIRKVVWPTRQETTQTTLIVVAVVVVMALILWGLDTFLGWLASRLIG